MAKTYNISASKLGTFYSCGELYHNRYILKKPSVDLNVRMKMRGSAFHGGLDKSIKDLGDGKVNSLLGLDSRLVLKNCLDVLALEEKSYNEYLSDNIKMEFLKVYSDCWSFLQDKWAIFKDWNIQSEVSFNLKFPKLDGIETEYNLVGIIDYILESPEGEVVILDGKTSKSRGVHTKNIQLYFYNYLYLLTHKIVPSRSAFYFFNSGKFLDIKSKELTKEAILALSPGILGFIEAHSNGNYKTNTSKISFCDACDYGHACNDYKEVKSKRLSETQKYEKFLVNNFIEEDDIFSS